MDRDELIEELKKCPPGKVLVKVYLTNGEMRHYIIDMVTTVPSPTIHLGKRYAP